jgi:hypothetical protein
VKQLLTTLAFFFLMLACGRVESDVSTPKEGGLMCGACARQVNIPQPVAVARPIRAEGVMSLDNQCLSCNLVPTCSICSLVQNNQAFITLPDSFPPVGDVLLVGKDQTLQVTHTARRFTAILPAGSIADYEKLRIVVAVE